MEFRESTLAAKELENRYQEALDYLVNQTKFGINLGLGRIEALMKSLGNPEQNLKVIHVGGTNGKGSTTAMIAKILEEAGFRVGVFTSPHLHDYRERISINGEMISKAEVVELINTIRPHLEEIVAGGVEHPTEFEVNTAMALTYFADHKVDFALMEVGLGGAIDSTNVVHPLVSVITNVGMDHMDYLGNTYEEIAEVKAGIIKPNSVVITAASRPEVLKVIEAKADSVDAPHYVIGRDILYEINESGKSGQEFGIIGLNENYKGLHINLIGKHQVVNATTAVAVCEVLKTKYNVNIERIHIYEGLNHTVWPGRLELISDNPKVLLDGAHNLDGAESLVNALELFERERLVLCLGMLGDKEREKVVSILAPVADEVIITKPNNPRAGDWQYLGQLIENLGKNVTTIEDPKKAAIEAYSRLGSNDMLCVTGSLYMLADAREALLDFLNQKGKLDR